MKLPRWSKVGVMILALLVGSAGCIGQTVRFDEFADSKYDATQPKYVTASACGFQLLLVIPININSRAHRAYDQLLTEAGPDYIVKDIKVQEVWYYALVGTVYCTEFKGTAYPKIMATTSPDSNEPAPPVPAEP